MSNGDGKFNFMNLAPGNYYLRPVLKEYLFDPPSLSISVTDGGDHTVTIKSTRVAYSAYGTVKSLNADPEKFVTVEAIGETDEYEQTQTDALGSYRIRGLLPGKKYRIAVKSSELERSSPVAIETLVAKEDVTGNDFVVFRRPTNALVYGTVNTPAEHISTLQLTLKSEEFSQNAQLSLANYFEFKNLQKGKYLLIAKSSLNSQYYEHSLQEIPIVVESENVHVTVNYTISVKSEHLQDISAAPVMALVVGFALIAVIFYYEKVKQFFLQQIHIKIPPTMETFFVMTIPQKISCNKLSPPKKFFPYIKTSQTFPITPQFFPPHCSTNSPIFRSFNLLKMREKANMLFLDLRAMLRMMIGFLDSILKNKNQRSDKYFEI
jgi:hypothetical protein